MADGATDDERSCRQVLTHAEALAAGWPAGSAALKRPRRRLEEGLAAGALAGEPVTVRPAVPTSLPCQTFLVAFRPARVTMGSPARPEGCR
jgi:hypothetical protein